jgi:hypothetical protein
MSKEKEGTDTVVTPDKPEKPVVRDIRWPDVPPVYIKSASVAIIGGGLSLVIAGIKYVFFCGC